MIKIFIKSLTDVTEALRGEYIATEGGFVLDADTKEYKTKIDEFRGNNIRLTQQVEAFGDATPEKYRQLQTDYDKLKASPPKPKGGGAPEEVERITAEYEQRLKQALDGKTEAETKALGYRGKLNEYTVDNVVARAISNVGKVHKGALPDILARARQIWEVNDIGVPVAMSEGKAVYGADGKLPLTVEEYAQGLLKDAAYFFEGNSGGGAGGSSGAGGSGGAGGKKTITREEYQTGKYIDSVAKGETVVVD